MKSISITLLAIIYLSTNAIAAPVVLDLSRSHSIEDLKRSELHVRNIAGGSNEQAYSFENQTVEIRLPTGRSVAHTVVLGIIDTEKGKLTRLSMTGDVLPQDQAVQVARMFHDNFGLSRSPLDLWEAQNRGKTRNGAPYSISANMNFYPRIGIGIDPSMNGLYPWCVRLSLSWEWDKQHDWDEARAWRELPPPVVAAISLNPPGGKKYDRRDAYREALEAQAKLEQEQAAKSIASAPTITPGLSQTPNAAPTFSSPVQAPKPPVAGTEVSKSAHWPWIIGAMLLLAVAGAALAKSLRK